MGNLTRPSFKRYKKITSKSLPKNLVHLKAVKNIMKRRSKNANNVSYLNYLKQHAFDTTELGHLILIKNI